MLHKSQVIHENEIRTLQKAAFRQMAEENWVLEDGTTLRGETRNCNERIWSWEKENAIRSVDEIKKLPTKRPELLQYLSSTTNIIDNKLSAALNNQKMAGRLLLAAAVSHEIYSRTVNQRFLVFYTPIRERGQNGDGGTDGNGTKVLEDTYDLLEKREFPFALVEYNLTIRKGMFPLRIFGEHNYIEACSLKPLWRCKRARSQSMNRSKIHWLKPLSL